MVQQQARQGPEEPFALKTSADFLNQEESVVEDQGEALASFDHQQGQVVLQELLEDHLEITLDLLGVGELFQEGTQGGMLPLGFWVEKEFPVVLGWKLLVLLLDLAFLVLQGTDQSKDLGKRMLVD